PAPPAGLHPCPRLRRAISTMAEPPRRRVREPDKKCGPRGRRAFKDGHARTPSWPGASSAPHRGRIHLRRRSPRRADHACTAGADHTFFSTGSNWSPPQEVGAMGLGETVLAVGAGERPASFEQFSAAIEPAWIAAALAATGTASVRRRKLPAEHVVWLVIGMGLFHDRSIAQVVQHLDLVLPTRNGGRGQVTNAAIVQARDQLGAKPLATLFAQTAAVWSTAAADATRWRGLAVYGLDGTTLRVADTPENAARFGRPGSRHGEGAGYPQLRLVALSVLRHHLVAAAALGPYRTSEITLATPLWAAVPDRALVIFDRGFCSYALFHALAEPARHRHWLVRAKMGRTALKAQAVRRLGPGDHLVDLQRSHATRTAYP